MAFTPTYSWFPKKWGTEAGDQPQSSEPVCPRRTLQGVGYPHLAGPIETRGMVGKNRSQRSLSGDPNPLDTQRLPQVSIHRQNITSRACNLDYPQPTRSSQKH